MIEGQFLTGEQIDREIASLRKRENLDLPERKHGATVGDWLLIKQSLAEGEVFERKLFVVGENDLQESTA